LLGQAQDFSDLVIVKCSYYDYSQIKGDSLQEMTTSPAWKQLLALET